MGKGQDNKWAKDQTPLPFSSGNLESKKEQPHNEEADTPDKIFFIWKNIRHQSTLSKPILPSQDNSLTIR